MKKTLKKWEKLTGLGLVLLVAIGLANIGIGDIKVQANSTAQTLPFTQNWSNIGQITANDDWSGVQGIIGYLGDDPATTVPDLDPRTITQDSITIDVNANQTNPDTFTSGGVTEFEITNPTIAFQGSGTADFPNIVIFLNTTGQSNIQVAFNARDIDMGTDVVQQLNVQYRVAGNGVFVNVAGGYFPDVTSAGATQVTPVSLTLPADANNQALVEVRIMTTNATGSDEFIGIDDINITAGGGGGGTPTPTPSPSPTASATPTPTPGVSRANVDFNGDRRSDYVITRNQNSLKVWWVAENGSNNVSIFQWGLPTDIETPADFDGDGRSDYAVWRDEPTNPDEANFYIIRSSDNTVRIEQFGRTGDDPSIVGDYDGDGRADPAVYREGVNGENSIFFYRPSTIPGLNFIPRPYGLAGDKPVPGDYDGDGRFDFCVARTITGGQNLFIVLQSSNLVDRYFEWGLSTDSIVAGDYDGDRRHDFCVVRVMNGQLFWYILEADGGGTGAAAINWGLAGDIPTPGDYDGDGRQDIAIWRPSVNPSGNVFYVRRSSDTALQAFTWGLQTDYPISNWFVVNGTAPVPTPTPTPTPSVSPTPTPTPGPTPSLNVVINEVDSDTPGNDTLEFVELYDGGAGNTALDGLVVVFYNGSNDQSYSAFDLDGFRTNANGYFTLGNAVVPGVDLIFADNLLQNGQDAVGLYAANGSDFPNGTAVTTTNLRDALVYDTSDADDPGLLVLLNPGEPQIDENGTGTSATVSMQRCPNGTGGARNSSTYRVQLPTSDGANTCADPTPTPTPGPPPNFSGQATSVVGTVSGIAGILNDTGILPPNGGFINQTLTSGTLFGGSLTTANLDATAQAALDQSRSQAISQNVNFTINGNVITANLIPTSSQCTCVVENSPPQCVGGVMIDNLQLNGTFIPNPSSPNTVVAIPNGGQMILDERIQTINGNNGTLRINGVRVTFPGENDVIFSKSESGISCNPAPTPTPTPTSTPTTFTGRALSVSGTVAGTSEILNDTGNLPLTGGFLNRTLTSGSLFGGTLTTADLNATAQAAFDQSRSQAIVQNLSFSVNGNLITADLIPTSSQCTCVAANTPPQCAGGVMIDNLRLNGTFIPNPSSPNTVVAIPNGGQIILDERIQTTTGNNGTLTINGVHVLIPGIADVNFARVESGILCGANI